MSIICVIVGLIASYASGIWKDLILKESISLSSNVFAASHEGFTLKSAKGSKPVRTTSLRGLSIWDSTYSIIVCSRFF